MDQLLIFCELYEYPENENLEELFKDIQASDISKETYGSGIQFYKLFNSADPKNPFSLYIKIGIFKKATFVIKGRIINLSPGNNSKINITPEMAGASLFNISINSTLDRIYIDNDLFNRNGFNSFYNEIIIQKESNFMYIPFEVILNPVSSRTIRNKSEILDSYLLRQLVNQIVIPSNLFLIKNGFLKLLMKRSERINHMLMPNARKFPTLFSTVKAPFLAIRFLFSDDRLLKMIRTLTSVLTASANQNYSPDFMIAINPNFNQKVLNKKFMFTEQYKEIVDAFHGEKKELLSLISLTIAFVTFVIFIVTTFLVERNELELGNAFFNIMFRK